MYVDRASALRSKYGEELCGDQIGLVETPDSVIAVLSDGLGSGVKANILASITTKIISTMLKGGARLDDVVDTLIRTLPICQVRQVAYSTFSIIQVFNSGELYTVEFDNPQIIYLRQNQPFELERRSRKIGSLTVFEATCQVELGDIILAMSDGVIHAGIGRKLDFGWQWEKIVRFVSALSRRQYTPSQICDAILSQASSFQDGVFHDDASVICLSLRERRTLTAIVGPPKNPGDDSRVARLLWEESGQRVVCGGTTAQIIAREWDKQVEVDLDMDWLNEDDAEPLPPTARIDSVNLVTEGIITLSKVLEYLQRKEMPNNDNAAVKLIEAFEQADEISFILGSAINPAHQNPDLPLRLTIKQQVVQDLSKILETNGKIVHLDYL